MKKVIKCAVSTKSCKDYLKTAKILSEKLSQFLDNISECNDLSVFIDDDEYKHLLDVVNTLAFFGYPLNK